MVGLWLVLFFVLSAGQTVRSPTCSRHLRRPKPGYHLTKECAASNMRTVAASNVPDAGSCEELAAAKNAFAFSYADANRSEGLNNTANCNVYECPEFRSFLLTENTSVYSYYSMYSKPLPGENYTCAPGIGVFHIVTDPQNYSNAMVACEDAGGHLANVGSDSRTSFLASLVSSALVNHTASYRKAFVGLFFDGGFVAVTGEPLNCLPFRAWAPGHPKASKLKKDCTVVTSNKYWKTVDCTLKLPYICELIPDGPLSPVERYCAPISNEKRRKNCILRNHKQFQNDEQSNQIKYQCFDRNINKKKIEVTDNNN